MSAPKRCSPSPLAGGNGLSADAEGADGPAPHAPTVPGTGTPRKAGGCLLVWRGGMVPLSTSNPALTLADLLILTRAQEAPSS